MADQRADGVAREQRVAGAALKRRGLIAGAAALAAGLVSQRGAQSVGASTGDPLTAGNAFTETTRFILKNTRGTVSAPVVPTADGGGAAFQATDGNSGVAGYGYGGGNGVYGETDRGQALAGVCGLVLNAPGVTGGKGVYGEVNNPNGTGVYGKAASTNSFGVFGEANGTGGTGLHGDAVGTGGIGVKGNAGNAADSTAIGVRGNAGTGVGVAGYCSSAAQGASGGRGVYGEVGNPNGTGVYGKATGITSYGLYGEANTTGSVGVRGDGGRTGVYGYTPSNAPPSSSTPNAGVFGTGTRTGVYGAAGGVTNAVGVFAEILASPSTDTFAVKATNASTGTGNIGVQGECDAATGTGVQGIGGGTGVLGSSSGGTGVSGVSNGSGAGNGHGVYGFVHHAGATAVTAGVFGDSDASYGIIGRTTAAGYSGLTAITGTPNVAALAATSTVGTAYAAYFTGKTVVEGDFYVVSGAKSAAVPHADGTHRAVYCVESPESWFEDFGEGKLVGGKADVTFDTEFAAIVHTDNYAVFLTPEGDCKGLYVTAKSGGGFAVRELQGGTNALAFRWRVVAKRKDIKGERLAKVDLPKINHPDPDKLPRLDLPRP